LGEYQAKEKTSNHDHDHCSHYPEEGLQINPSTRVFFQFEDAVEAKVGPLEVLAAEINNQNVYGQVKGRHNFDGYDSRALSRAA
jgi:hypothetical protein